MNQHTVYGAVLMALALLFLSALPALAFKQHWKILRGDARLILRAPLRYLHLLFGSLWAEEFGVTITYCTPILGAPSTTAPTASQAAQVNDQIVQVAFVDTDTQAVLTHNWGAAGKYPNSFTTWLLPVISFIKALGGSSDISFADNFTFGLTNTNSVTMNKINVGSNSGGTWNVYLRLPWPSPTL